MGASRILIADGGHILRMARAEIHAEGYRGAEAVDRASLLELLSEHSAAGVVVDVDMPTGEGWQTLEDVLTKFGDVPVIAVASSEADAERARELGASECLIKPFGAITLVDLVRRVFGPPD